MRPPEDLSERECVRLGLQPKNMSDRRKTTVIRADYLLYFGAQYHFKLSTIPPRKKNCYVITDWDEFYGGVQWLYAKLEMEVNRVGVNAGDILIWEGTDVQMYCMGQEGDKTTAANCNWERILTLRTRGRLKRPRNDENSLDEIPKTKADTTTERPPKGCSKEMHVPVPEQEWLASYPSQIRPGSGDNGTRPSGNGFQSTVKLRDRHVASSKPAVKMIDGTSARGDGYPATPESSSADVRPVEPVGDEAAYGDSRGGDGDAGEDGYFYRSEDDSGTDSGDAGEDGYFYRSEDDAGMDSGDDGEDGYFYRSEDDAGTDSDDDGEDDDSADEYDDSGPPAKKRKTDTGDGPQELAPGGEHLERGSAPVPRILGQEAGIGLSST